MVNKIHSKNILDLLKVIKLDKNKLYIKINRKNTKAIHLISCKIDV